MKKALLFLFVLGLAAGLRAQAASFLPQSYVETRFSAHPDTVWVLDFWASWCGPCLRSMPKVKEAYTNLLGQKVRFISVSIDKKDSAWQAALVRLALPWEQCRLAAPVSNPRFKEVFTFNYIPSLYVIDKMGTAHKVPAESLEAEVRKYL